MSLTAADIVERSKIKNLEGVYVLGSLARRVTLHSQQKRAFNLIWALFENKLLQAGQKVAVVGGGLAGMTAAAAASLKDCNVTLFEKSQQLMNLQAGNYTRFIHPNIYDWPAEVSENPSTILPCLNWNAGIASNIVTELRIQFESIIPSTQIELNTEINSITNIDGRPRIQSIHSAGPIPYDCIIIAVGFGMEKQFDAVSNRFYWQNDDLHQSLSIKRKYFVTGCGDGGLVDTLRLLLLNFDHQRFTIDFLHQEELNAVKLELLKIEEKIKSRSSTTTDTSTMIFDHYDNLNISNAVLKNLKELIRTDTEVTLNGTEISRYSKDASILNRFTIYLLSKCGALRYECGRVENITRSGTQYTVQLRRTDNTLIDLEYDDVVVRHGPNPVLPRLLDAQTQLPEFPEPDHTFHPMWPQNFYPIPPRPAAGTLMDNASNYHKELISYCKQIGNYVSVSFGVNHNDMPYFDVKLKPDSSPSHLDELKEYKGIPVIVSRDPLPQVHAFDYRGGGIEGSGGYRDRDKLIGGVIEIGIPIANYNQFIHQRQNSYNSHSYGTLGCFIKTLGDKVGFLSTSHSIGLSRFENKDIVTWTENDITKTPNIIGQVYSYTPIVYKHEIGKPTINEIDAAIVLLSPSKSYRTNIKFQSNSFNYRGTGNPSPGQKVFKKGARTGLTFGKITSVFCLIEVIYDANRVAIFDNVFEVTGSTGKFSDAGDSGAMVFSDDGRALGIILAGDNFRTIVCPIKPILERFRCDILY